MKQLSIFLVTLTVISMSISCSSPDTPDQIAIKQIDSLFTSLYPADEPGAAILILKGDSTFFNKGYGIADIDTKVPVDGKTFFCIASVSKQFAGVALMILQEEGKLSLDDNVSKFFPHFKAPFFKEITLRHLLSHTSGIPDSRPYHDRQFVLTATDEVSYSYMQNIKELNFKPGTDYEYMNPTFQLMYTIIEKCSGMPFDDFMRERIFLPSGMMETTYFEEGKYIPRMAHGYSPKKEGGFRENDYGEASFFATKADGAIYTSVEEFALWEKALRNNILIPAHIKEEAHSAKIQISDKPYTGYGYGWFIEEKPGFPKKVYHTGSNGGFRTIAFTYPNQKILTVIFSTRDDKQVDATAGKVEQIMKNAGWLD